MTQHAMFCLRCDGECFTITERPILQAYKGHEITVTSPCAVCDHCDYVTVAPGQVDELVKRTKAAYDALPSVHRQQNGSL